MGPWVVTMAVVAGLLVASPVAGQQASPAIEVTGATYLEVDDTSGLWQMRGNPVVVMRGTRSVRAASMIYDSRHQILYARERVTFTDEMSQMMAEAVTAFLQEDRVLAEGGVAMVVREHGQETQLRCSRLELWSAERRALAIGDVTLAHGEVTITSDRLEYDGRAQRAVATGQPQMTVARARANAERIEVELEQEEVRADGAVRLVSDDLEGSAPHMVLQNAQQLATLSGGAMVRQGRTEVRAEVVMVDLQRKRISASGGVHIVAYPNR